MMRDALPRAAATSDLFGFWHNLTIESPRINFCAMEKIGTKHWRKVQCKLNAPKRHNPRGLPCQADEETASANASSVVFLRDPLERFLSGFLDKCVNPVTLRMEPHCEPSEVFREQNSLLDGIKQDKKIFFETYVETMPLKWNIHFFPQSLYCEGLFRSIHGYEFVGQMGVDFYDDVHDLSMHFEDTRLTKVLNHIFDFKNILVHEGGNNVGVETSASSKVHQYYTPRTLRRVLQYVSIDYIHLGIPIPLWADQMLREEVKR